MPDLTCFSPSADPPTTNKKSKKAAAQKNTTATTWDLGDPAVLNRRAERFQREHEIERQKHLRNQGATLKANPHGAHLLNRITRADSPSTYGPNPDDPEADPVSGSFLFCLHATVRLTCHSGAERPQLGSVYDRGYKSGAFQRLSTLDIGAAILDSRSSSLSHSSSRNRNRR